MEERKPLAPHQIAALKHSFGGNMKIPDNVEQFPENAVDSDEYGVSSSTPLAPHHIAALKYSFGGHSKNGINLFIAVVILTGEMAGSGMLQLPFSMVGTGK